MRYLYRRLRSWWYWRRYESPGRTVTEHLAFAQDNLSAGRPYGGWDW